MQRRPFFAFTTLGALLLVSSSAVMAQATTQTFPNKPITLLVPFAPGGTTDLIARIGRWWHPPSSGWSSRPPQLCSHWSTSCVYKRSAARWPMEATHAKTYPRRRVAGFDYRRNRGHECPSCDSK